MEVPFYRHSLNRADAELIANVFDSPILTSGAQCKAVEAQIQEYFSVSYAKMVNSWTNGAVAALLALDIGPGDEVIVPAQTFIASSNVVELVGAKPIFVDVDPDTLLITSEFIEPAITKNTKAIIPVHMYGQMCDMKAMSNLAKKYNLAIIEDCAHAFEAKLNDERPGKYSDFAIFSFYATKNVTCGEGGAVITNNENLYSKLIQTVLHGMSAGAADRFQKGQYRHWGMERLGTKANLPDILAALLPPQIKTIDERLPVREKIAKTYEEFFSGTPVVTPKINQGVVHSRHLFPIKVAAEFRDQVLFMLGEAQIGTTVNYRAVPTLDFYKNKYGFRAGQFPNSETWGDGTLSLPLFPGMSELEQNYVIETFEKGILPLLGSK
ncbi:MAG: DegT/DnrJ/EryC1/StrS family aminotransferase [Candidatus Nanopelagicales bacterium]